MKDEMKDAMKDDAMKEDDMKSDANVVDDIICRMYFNRHVRDKVAVDGGVRSKFGSFEEMMGCVPVENVVKYRNIFVEYCKTIEAMEFCEAVGWLDRWVEYYRGVLVMGVEMAKLSGATIDEIIGLKDEEAVVKRQLDEFCVGNK